MSSSCSNSSAKLMIIPAAGYGTRMQILTFGKSKELIEVGGVPAIMYALNEAYNAGITHVGIIIRKGKEDILRFINNDSRMDSLREALQIKFFYQINPTGEVGAILTAADWIGDHSFAVHYPDNIVLNPFGILSEFLKHQAELKTDTVLLTNLLEGAQTPLCDLELVDHNLYRLTFGNSPESFSYGLRPTGVYIATPFFIRSGIELLQDGNVHEIKDMDVRRLLALKGNEVHGINLNASVLDVGNPAGYQLAESILNLPLEQGSCVTKQSNT